MQVSSISVKAGVVSIFSLLIALPLLPWMMGIVTDTKHVIDPTIPAENRGAYLVLDDGIMQLYTWRVEPDDFPSDAPYLNHDLVKAIVMVQKQFDHPENYLLYNLTENTKVEWSGNINNQEQLRFQFDELAPGKYMLVAPNDSMYGGVTFHFFGVN